MGTFIKKYWSVAVFIVCGLITVPTAADQVRARSNIVIGTGCASTCVNNHCETSCGTRSDDSQTHSTEVIEKSFNYVGFSKIEISDIETEVVYGDSYRVTLKAAPDNIDAIRVSLAQQALTVSLPNNYRSVQRAKIVINTPNIRSLKASGNADVSLAGFASKSISLAATDNANLSAIGCEFSELVLTSSSNADIDLSHSVVHDTKLVAGDNTNVLLRFAMANESVKSSSLTGRVKGMADVAYCGQPSNTLMVSGMSDVRKINCSAN